MPKWGIADEAVTANSSTTVESSNGAPIGTYALVKGGGGANAHYGNTSAGSRANVDSHMFGNTTPGAFIPGQAVGVFGADVAETTAAAGAITHAGWQVLRQGTGPITALTVNTANVNSGFANGETITVSGTASVNATGVVVANATGNMTSVTVTVPGQYFMNTSGLTVTFNREEHLTALTVAANTHKHLLSVTVASTPTGYNNTDYITISNGTINATATFVTNATGGFATGNVTVTVNGDFAAAKANADLVLTIFAANGSASNGSGGTFTGNLVADAILGYNNTDVIVISNGSVNATATVSTNSLGGFASGNLTITNPGVFAAGQVNTTVVIAAQNSSGGASNGAYAVFSAGLTNSTGGQVLVTLGGRAGRKHFETLVAMSSIATDASDDTLLPDA